MAPAGRKAMFSGGSIVSICGGAASDIDDGIAAAGGQPLRYHGTVAAAGVRLEAEQGGVPLVRGLIRFLQRQLRFRRLQLGSKMAFISAMRPLRAASRPA